MRAMASERTELLKNWNTLTQRQQGQIGDLQKQGGVDDSRIKELEGMVSQLTKDNRECERRCVACDRKVERLSKRLSALEEKR